MGLLVPDHLKPPQDRPPIDRARTKALAFSYLPDWTITLALWVIFIGIDQIDGYRRQFSLTDTSIQHSYTENERIPVWLLAVLVGLVPLLFFFVIGFAIQRSFWDWHVASLGLILSQAITWVITDAIKLTVGRPRPDMLARCKPIEGSMNAAYYGLANWAQVCSDTSQLKDGFRSFPSGHSSSAFAGLGFLAFYFAAKLHVFDRRGYTAPAWIAMAPILGAALIAVSRTMDYRHHATDVIAGGIIGILVSYFCYRLYYPKLSDRNCHLPYEPRIETRPTHDDHSSEVLPLHNSRHSSDARISMNGNNSSDMTPRPHM